MSIMPRVVINGQPVTLNKLAREIKMDAGNLSRALKGGGSISLVQAEYIARKFGFTVDQFAVDHGLTQQHKQVTVNGVTTSESRLVPSDPAKKRVNYREYKKPTMRPPDPGVMRALQEARK